LGFELKTGATARFHVFMGLARKIVKKNRAGHKIFFIEQRKNCKLAETSSFVHIAVSGFK